MAEASVADFPGPDIESEITWLLHRAAQRMRGATGAQAELHGLSLRDYIVMSALDKTPNLTQGELGKVLGLDKTTLMSQLDRLERRELVERQSDPRDRRTRIPVLTSAGATLRATVATACSAAEDAVLGSYSEAQVRVLRLILAGIIGESQDRGSCL